MPIQIKSKNGNINFYTNDDEEPAAIIYQGGSHVLVLDVVMSMSSESAELSELLAIVYLFMDARETNESDRRYKKYDVIYNNALMYEVKETKYTPNQLLSRCYSGNVVTVNKKTRIRFKFMSFECKNNKLIINYNPVIW